MPQKSPNPPPPPKRDDEFDEEDDDEELLVFLVDVPFPFKPPPPFLL